MEQLLAKGSVVAAPLLLDGILTYVDVNGNHLSGRIVETEAYPPDDPSTYKFSGKKLSQSAHFAKAGTIFMHFSHGAYNCLNISCGEQGQGDSLLIRAIEPLTGMDVMWWNRYGEPLPNDPPTARRRNLTSGPGKLIQALGVLPSLNGLSLFDPTVTLSIELPNQPIEHIHTTRIGLTKGANLSLRWYDGRSSFVSQRG